jgi:hypothetical protein
MKIKLLENIIFIIDSDFRTIKSYMIVRAYC